MKASEYRSKSTKELRENLLQLRRESFSLRMQRASDQLSQTHLLETTRRDIARIKTLLRARDGETQSADSA